MDGLDTYKPTISIDSKELPEIKDWKIGESYDLIISVKQTGIHEVNPGQVRGEFEIQSIMSAEKDPMDLEDINNMNSNEDFMKASGKMKQDTYSK